MTTFTTAKSLAMIKPDSWRPADYGMTGLAQITGFQVRRMFTACQYTIMTGVTCCDPDGAVIEKFTGR